MTTLVVAAASPTEHDKLAYLSRHFTETITYLRSLFSTYPQRSPEWYENTKHSIGGSKAAALVNAHYSLRSHQLPDHVLVPPPPIVPTLPLIIGTFFESLHIQLASMILNTPLLEVGQYIANKYMHFSPDGIGVDPYDRVVMCEFKTPYTRCIKAPPENAPYQVMKSYEIQCQYSMMLLQLIQYSYFQDLCIWAHIDRADATWCPKSEFNAAKRYVAGPSFGSARCEFYLPLYDNQPKAAGGALHNLATLPKHLLIYWLLDAKSTQPWTINLSNYGVAQILKFRQNVLQYEASINMFNRSALPPDTIMEQPNCFIECDLQMIGMAMIKPDKELHTVLTASLKNVITEIEKKRQSMTVSTPTSPPTPV